MANRQSDKRSGPSQRQLRVGELIRHALAEMLARAEIHDDVLAAHVVTVAEVRMSPDLRLATIYIMPLGGKDLKSQIRSRPPILLIHGDADEIVPIKAMHAALESLAAADCPARFHVSRGLGHGIDGQGLSLGGAFLADCFTRAR